MSAVGRGQRSPRSSRRSGGNNESFRAHGQTIKMEKVASGIAPTSSIGSVQSGVEVCTPAPFIVAACRHGHVENRHYRSSVAYVICILVSHHELTHCSHGCQCASLPISLRPLYVPRQWMTICWSALPLRSIRSYSVRAALYFVDSDSVPLACHF